MFFIQDIYPEYTDSPVIYTFLCFLNKNTSKNVFLDFIKAIHFIDTCLTQLYMIWCMNFFSFIAMLAKILE